MSGSIYALKVSFLTLVTGFARRKKVYDGFVMEYAAAEDGIRVLWEQLLKAHQKFLVSCSIVCASGFGLQNCVC